ncbi:MAG TPA: DNA ligase D [Dongiaceae bacterium]|nr:DNA ligase D [Dongiaceae bacterium]
MALEVYRKKRDFKKTPEPAGRKARKKGNSFVIQKHDARRLHYDFRLEMDGVLKSWAVTRGPSLVPSDKRLAVHVEDHPLEYGGFEGTIPQGEYGGGTVILWDRGTWTPLNDAHKGYAKGHLEFELDGEKLHGRWHLVRMPKRRGEKRENWLLIKGDDEAARDAGDPDILEERPESVKTGRVVEDVAGEAPGWSSKTGKIDKRKSRRKVTKKPAARKTAKTRHLKASSNERLNQAALVDPAQIKGAKKAAMPAFVEPSLATLVTKPPTGRTWVHEIKYDGYRLQARLEAGRVKLLTRTGLDWSKKFGKEIVAAIQAIPVGRALIDGELVVEAASGVSDFSALQADLSEGRGDRMVFYAFDLLYLDGYDLRRAALTDRKQALRGLLSGIGDPLRYSEHFEEDGDLILRHACRLSLEGLVSKQGDAPYHSGRSKSWVKSKCSERQEFVVGGYVPSTVSRKAIGSLLLGVNDHGKLRYVGRVGTGYTATVAEDLMKRLERIRADKSPFDGPLPPEDARKVRFARPQLVVEIEVRGWTADSILRHASYRGLREDKEASEVVKETTKAKTKAKQVPAKATRGYKLTHPDRLYWPEDGVTKEGLADYYADVWKFMGPLVVDRPLALLRCPEGIVKQCFFQKHAWKGMNKAIKLVVDPEHKDEPLVSIHDFDGLIGLVQGATLEIHPWGARIRDLERPDYITMDLDPGEGVAWSRVIEAAKEVRDRLEQAGLKAFLKTSGGKGLHVVAPLKPKAEWPAVKDFTKGIAEAMAKDSPQKYVATITKSKRRGKILIDYLRNGRNNTAIAAYSARARKGAAVSMPLRWTELSEDVRADHFTVMNAPTRLNSLKSDPWADFFASAVPLETKTRGKRR